MTSTYEVTDQAGADHSSLWKLEQKRFGVDHAEVGAALAEQWKLPPRLVAPIRYHERPDDAEDDVVPLVRSVALGNRVAEIFLHEDTAGIALQTYHTQLAEWFDAPGESADPMLGGIHRQTEEMAQLFDLPAGNHGNPDEILARANETLTEITLQAQQQNRQLVDEANHRLVDGTPESAGVRRIRHGDLPIGDEQCSRQRSLRGRGPLQSV